MQLEPLSDINQGLAPVIQALPSQIPNCRSIIPPQKAGVETQDDPDWSWGLASNNKFGENSDKNSLCTEEDWEEDLGRKLRTEYTECKFVCTWKGGDSSDVNEPPKPWT
jgi:hypothetical protein